MTKHRTKAGLIEAIQVERRRLEQTLATIPAEEMDRNNVVGSWWVKDVLAHITAWEQLLLNWYDAGLRGEQLSPPLPTGMSRKAEDALNKDIYEQNRRRSLTDVMNEFQNSYRKVFTTVQEIGEEEMFTPGRYDWTGKLILADYIASNTCNHCIWARSHIRKWQKARESVGDAK